MTQGAAIHEEHQIERLPLFRQWGQKPMTQKKDEIVGWPKYPLA
jgi:hypothetical protein